MRTLFHFQEQALRYTQSTKHPALFLEMRLGKTLVAIRACRKWGADRILVVAPLPVLEAWEGELREERVAPVRNWHEDRKSPAPRRGWELTNYEALLHRFKRGNPQEFFSWVSQFEVVILDESTRVRNPKALTSKLCLESFPGARHRMVLSGCPAPESPLDYFGQFAFLRGSFLGCRNYWSFRNRYFSMAGYDWVPKPGTRAAIKAEVHRLGYFLSRAQAGIGSRKVYEVRRVQPTAGQLLAQKKLESGFEFGAVESTKWAVVVRSWLHRVAGGFGEEWKLLSDAKAKELVNLFEGELRRDKAIVLFRHNHELALAYRTLKKAGIQSVWINGSVPTPERRRRRLLFQNGAPRAALLQIQTCKMGLDFSAASAAIYYSNSLALEDRVQSEDRIVHVKKSEPLLYVDLVTSGSVDEDIVLALRDKKAESKFFMSQILERLKERIRVKFNRDH